MHECSARIHIPPALGCASDSGRFYNVSVDATAPTAKPPSAVWAACSSTESASNAACSALSCVLAAAISSVVKHGARQSSCVHVAPIVSESRNASVMPEPIM